MLCFLILFKMLCNVLSYSSNRLYYIDILLLSIRSGGQGSPVRLNQGWSHLRPTKDIVGKSNCGECVLKSKVKAWSGLIECALYCWYVDIGRTIKLDWLH